MNSANFPAKLVYKTRSGKSLSNQIHVTLRTVKVATSLFRECILFICFAYKGKKNAIQTPPKSIIRRNHLT